MRSIKKSIIPVKPVSTPDTLPDTFQLPLNYRQQHYNEFPYNQTDLTQKQNQPVPNIVKNESPPQSTLTSLQSQKHDLKTQLNLHKEQTTNVSEKKVEYALQDTINVDRSYNAPKTATDSQLLTEQEHKKTAQDPESGSLSGSLGVSSVDVKDVPLRLVGESRVLGDVDGGGGSVRSEVSSVGLGRGDLGSEGLVVSSKRLEVDSEGVERSGESGFGGSLGVSSVDVKDVPLRLGSDEQEINTESIEPSFFVDHMDSIVQLTESLLKMQDSAQIEEGLNSSRVDAELKHARIESEVNSINKITTQSSVNNFENHLVHSEIGIEYGFENIKTSAFERFIETLDPEVRQAPFDAANIDGHQNVADVLDANLSLEPSKKTVTAKLYSDQSLPVIGSAPCRPSFPSKFLASDTVVTPLNLVAQDNSGMLRAKPPKPVLSVPAMFSKPQLQKEPETIVTIHIERIEVHAVRAPVPSVSLPRNPVLSLSEYLKQRSEGNYYE
jgi:hypothetical protein